MAGLLLCLLLFRRRVEMCYVTETNCRYKGLVGIMSEFQVRELSDPGSRSIDCAHFSMPQNTPEDRT